MTEPIELDLSEPPPDPWSEPQLVEEVASERALIAANWKMNLLKSDAAAFCIGLRERIAQGAPPVAIFPSFPLLSLVSGALAGTDVETGAQDLHAEDKGAHTGDVSGLQLADAGATWVLCGHSERRRDHGEADEQVAAKVAAALRSGLSPLICVGETREERLAGETFSVLARQVRAAVAPLGSSPPRFALAYEPVWAIGTGDVATPEVANEAHARLRGLLAEALGAAVARSTPILYGGSVAPDNARGLAVESDIDGFLVGGASLDLGRFLSIISAFGRSA